MKSILVIEDNPLNRELVVDLLEADGFRVLAADSGEAGLELARQHRPDLILLDLSLPRLDGFAVAGMLKSDPVMCSIPVVAVSANTRYEDRKLAEEAGFIGFMSKPIDVLTFSRALSHWL